jgi:hypothetical protein
MLTLTARELEIILIWAEAAKDSPFPQEIRLYRRIATSAGRPLRITRPEAEMIVYWAEQDTRGRRGGAWYLLENEQKLIDKIQNFLSDCDIDPV